MNHNTWHPCNLAATPTHAVAQCAHTCAEGTVNALLNQFLQFQCFPVLERSGSSFKTHTHHTTLSDWGCDQTARLRRIRSEETIVHDSRTMRPPAAAVTNPSPNPPPLDMGHYLQCCVTRVKGGPQTNSSRSTATILAGVTRVLEPRGNGLCGLCRPWKGGATPPPLSVVDVAEKPGLPLPMRRACPALPQSTVGIALLYALPCHAMPCHAMAVKAYLAC
mmetsp:Transcript_57718/g.94786  ORF Transcript_57718/g.94786 Transcript_57718/m.94786 type:complete len:220 (+) Transcript_57718:525-1184(+)